MSKSTFFTGQPVFNQILKLIPKHIVKSISAELKSDYYCKRFSTYDHLVTMLYAIFNHCTSLREVTTGLLAWEQRIYHLGMQHYPRRSTISDANNRRSESVFEHIYLKLFDHYKNLLSDSHSSTSQKKLYIFDSTTITLFQEVLKGSGLSKKDGRRKGGIKVHTLIRNDHDVPSMICYSSAAANDTLFLKCLQLPEGSVIVFDRGYLDHTTFNRFTDQKITWITRLRSRSAFTVQGSFIVSSAHQHFGIISDQSIVMGDHRHPRTAKVPARLIVFKEPQTGKVFEFLTNNMQLSPTDITSYYKNRWQIELLFKRLKQNYPLNYFLGDSENAIKIQIWCVLIADLLLKVIKKASKCKWSFSNLVSMVRLHLMTYTDLTAFLHSAEKTLLIKFKQKTTFPYLQILFPT